MSLHFFPTTARAGTRRADARRVAPAVEVMEERTVLSAVAMVPPAAAHVAPAAHAHATAGVSLPVSITGVTLTNLLTNTANKITGVAGTLTGTIAGQTFSTPFQISPSATATHAGIPILDLHISPIHLSLLGLNVDTSNICVDISAQRGPGNLLGNLVGGIANLLNGGITAPAAGSTAATGLLGALSGALNLPLSAAHGATGSIMDVLNGALGQTLGSLANPSVTGATTNILNLSVGPVKLNLLGLHVNVDNCANGPVTVAVTATSGPGDLLGNLLTGVAGLLNNTPLNLAAIQSDLNQIVGVIEGAAPAPPVSTV